MSSAMAVQTNGSALAFQCSTWVRMRWMRWLIDTNVPRRIACLVMMMPNQISIWFIQLDPTG
jgi:hypothetical protein